MNAFDTSPPPVRALVDNGGRLVEADDRLIHMNARAGGAIGMTLAVPQLATLVRLASRLRVLVSRSVSVADGDDDIDLWVRAEPTSDGVRLAITGWKIRTPWTPVERDDGDFVRAGADWLWETDAAMRLTFVSDNAVQFGVEVASMLGQPVTRLFSLIEGGDGGLPILGALAAQIAFEDQRATLRGNGREVLLEAAPRHDADDRFAGFVGAAHMVDDRVVDPVEPTPAKIPDAFSARLDQALRGPLTKIVANADSIHAQAEGPLKGEYADYAADIATAGRHLMGLVDDLLDLQAVERPDFSAAREPIDLADIARRAAGLLQVRAASADVRIDKPAPDDALPAIGEFRRALQVLVNLVGNALRYSPPGGMIWVRATRDSNVVAIIVADQGKGIAADDQARIFEKFERVDPSEPGGSGLGLYIARRLARAMGGDIVVDSAPGQGARFVFTLPGLPQSASDQDQAEPDHHDR